MHDIQQYFPLLIPVVVIEYGLLATALIHVLRHRNYKVGNRALWVVVVIFVQIVGPILYFVLGREDS